MKIAVASLNRDESGEISERAGRAPYFLVFDEEGNLAEVIENIHVDEMRGAGTEAAELLAGKGINIFVASDIGPRMAETLEAGGIEHRIMSGSAKEAIKKITGNESR